MGLNWRVSRRNLGLLTLRAVFLLSSTYGFVAGVQVMPIADALAIVFVEPFILLILGHLIFGDHIGPRRITAGADNGPAQRDKPGSKGAGRIAVAKGKQGGHGRTIATALRGGKA